MDGNLLKRMEYRINRRLRGMVPAVNQQEITKNIYGEVEISVGFFTILTLANLIALTPGTLSLDISTDRRVLYVHTMHLEDADGFRRNIKEGFERRLLEVFR